VQPREARAARREAEKAGNLAGKKGHPLVASGETAVDFRGAIHAADAETVGRFAFVEHYAEQRMMDDADLGEARAETARCTARTKFARVEAEEAVSEWKSAADKSPDAAKPKFLRTVGAGLIGLLGAASWAAAVAALQSGTHDKGWLTYVLGLFAIGGVLVGKSLGSLTRARDVDEDAKKFSNQQSRRLVAAVGLASILALGASVAMIRKTGADAEEARRALIGQVQLSLPGAGSAEVSAVPNLPVVPFPAWFLVEIAISGAAFSVDYLCGDPRRRILDDLEARAKKKTGTWKSEHEGLAGAAGSHETIYMRRADGDTAVALSADGQIQFSNVETNTYRDAHGLARAAGGNPWGKAATHDPNAPYEQVRSVVGWDVKSLVDESAENLPKKDKDRKLLKAAHRELSAIPEPKQQKHESPDDASTAETVPVSQDQDRLTKPMEEINDPQVATSPDLHPSGNGKK
jgi:hypothetical protein